MDEKRNERFLDIWTGRKIAAKGELTRLGLDRYISVRLRETVEYAVKNSEFYRRKFAEPYQDLTTVAFGEQTLCDDVFIERFCRLPFTTPQELSECGDDFLCVGRSEISRIVTLATGGSTGIPKRVCFTEVDQQLTVDFFENGMKLIVNETDRVLILMPAGMPGSIGKLLGQALRNSSVAVVEYGLPQLTAEPENEESEAETKTAVEAERLLDIIREQAITSVVALPTHMRILAQAEEKRRQQKGEDMRLRLRSVLLSAEYVADRDVELIERVFSCRVFEHYGMTEMGLGCAVSCGAEGYHIREADLYLEIIDPVSGRNKADGEWGEIVFTTLTRRGMPFIRYRTGDISRLITERCQCGSILKRLDKVADRNRIKGYLK